MGHLVLDLAVGTEEGSCCVYGFVVTGFLLFFWHRSVKEAILFAWSDAKS